MSTNRNRMAKLLLNYFENKIDCLALEKVERLQELVDGVKVQKIEALREKINLKNNG